MTPTASFRDPDGAVTVLGDRVLRRLTTARTDLITFLGQPAASEFVRSGQLVTTHVLPETSQGLLLEHGRIWFPSYPCEWAPEMLFEAAQLTLQLAESVLSEGYGLKDATPYNVLFEGAKPVFVDVASFEKRKPGDSVWLPYAQFMRMFVLPLLMHKQFGAHTHELLASHMHGIEPEEVLARCSAVACLKPVVLGSVTVPVLLGRKSNQQAAECKPAKPYAPDLAAFILRRCFKRLKGTLHAVKPRNLSTRSAWSHYVTECTYSETESALKQQLVREWLTDVSPTAVLDMGCNTGVYSHIAARLGARVVSFDTDPIVVGRLFQRARQERLDIQPLVVNVANPTAASGWRNAERPSFLDRAAGQFDAVLMLALLHHLLVTERVPLHEVLDMAAGLTKRALIIEYVDRNDPMFRSLLRGRDSLHSSFNQEFFERTCLQRFSIVKRQPVKGTLRILYQLEKK